MSNTNNPHGLRPLGWNLAGGPPFIAAFSKVVGYGTTLFPFDAVNRVADGSIEASATPGTTRYTGVVLDYGLLSTATNHLVVIDPLAVYEAQDDGAPGILAVDLGLNANLVLTAGNTVTKQSKHQIAHAGIDVTNTLDVHLLQLFGAPDNAHGPNARIEIIFNKHRMASDSVGV